MKVRKLLSFILAAAVILSSLSFSCAAASTDEYTVNGIEILSDSFLPLKSISYPEKVGIHASITKNTYSADSALVTLASYNPNGSLAETKLFRESGFSAGQSVGIYTTLNSVKDGYVKTFVWESLNSAKPLSASAEKYFSNFPVGISYDDTSDRIRVRGKVSATADGKAKIELAQKYDGELCRWETASGTLYADFNGYEISDGASAELMISGYPAKNKIIAVNENEIMLMSVRNQYYEINAVTLEDAQGNDVKSLKKGDAVFAGAYFTRIDASTFKEPYLSLELRDGEFNLIDSAVVSADEVNYNQTIHASAMFTVPEDFENCIIFANIYDDLAGTNAIAVQAKRELSDFGKTEIAKNTIKLKGRFADKFDNSAVFSVNEALVPINGASRWTTNFTDYVSDVCKINLNGINIDDIMGYEALLEVEISDSGIILKNAEKVEGSDYSDIPDDGKDLVLAKDGDYAKALAVLTAIGIANDTNLDKPLTRSMLAELLCGIDGKSEYAKLYKNIKKFIDVEPGSDINGFCVTADKLGYLSGYASGAFKPDSVMKYSDILTAVLSVIGYKNETDPVTSAINLGLAKGISATEENSITKANALILMYNALEVPMVNAKGESIGALLLNKLNVTKFDGTIEQTPLSDDTIKNGKIQVKYERQYTAVAGSYTLQRYYMNKAEDDANPSDVYGTSMSDARYKKATINVDERIKALAESYLDYNVEMYVKDATDSTAMLLSVYSDESKNKSISFNSRDIYESKTTLTAGSDTVYGTVAVYSDIDAGKYGKYDIEIEKVYVNGRQQTISRIGSIGEANAIRTVHEMYEVLQYYLDSDRYAEIKLFCNTPGYDYNIAYITDYANLVVDDVNEKTGTVIGKSYDKYSNLIAKVVFDEEYAGRFSIIKNGAAATLADIKKGDVLTIAGYVNSANELEYGKVIVTSEKTEGVVSTYDTDRRTIEIGDKTYYYNNYIGDKLGKEGSNGIKLGDNVILYIDARGYVVDMDKAAANKNLKYGFATKSVKSTSVEDSWKIRILTENGAWTTYDMASKVSFEGATPVSTTSMSHTDMQRNLDSTNISGSKILLNKVVAYETNTSNEINKIYVSAGSSTDYIFNYAAIDNKDYIEATSSLGNVYLNDDTVIFSYVRGTDLSREIDEDDIAVAKKDVFVNRNSYSAIAYGLDNDNCASVICGEGLVGNIALNGNFFVISNKTYATNADGDEGYNITGICGGEEVTVFADKNDAEVIDAEYRGADIEPTFTTASNTADVLSKGDIILYSQINGDVDKIYRLAAANALYDSANSGGLKYTLNDNIVNLAAFEEGGDSYSFLYGFAYNRKGNRLTLTNNPLAPDDLFDISGSAAICTVVNLFADGVKVEKVSLGDIESDKSGGGMGDTVFVRTFDDTAAEDIVIFKYTETPEIPPVYEPDPEPPVNPINPQYGFATKAVKSTGVEDTWQIRVLTESGKWTTYDMAGKVSFDGQTAVSTSSMASETMLDKLGGTVNGSKIILNKVIAYTTNADGEINRIYVTANEDSVFNNAVIDGKSYAEADASLGSVYLNDDTVIFSYAEGINISWEIDEDDISAGSKAVLADGKVYNAVAYGIDENGYAKAICGENIFEPQDSPDFPEKYSELKYGFTTKAVKSTGIEDSWKIRILTESGKWTTYDMAGRVSFDGQTAVSTTSISSDRMLSQLGGTLNGNKILLNKVIAYTTNPDSGEINKIYANAESGIDEVFNYRRIDCRDYIEATSSLGGVYLNDDTVIFSYAKGIDLSDEIYEDDIATAKKDSLINRNSYTAIAYGLDDENCARAICGEGLVGDIVLNDNFFVIGSKYNMTNADGDEGYNITGFVDGEEKTIFVDRNDTEVIDARYIGSYAEPTFTTASKTADVLSKGDIILYSQINGEVDKIYRLVKANDLKDASQSSGLRSKLGDTVKLANFEAGGDDYNFYCGMASGYSGNVLTLYVVGGLSLSIKSNVSGASVDLFASKIKVSLATSGDIDDDKTGNGKGDVVFVRTLNDTIVEDFVVFKANN